MNTDQEVYFVKQNHSNQGCETMIDYDRCSEADVLEGLISGEYENVVAVCYFNIAEGVARDVTDEFAKKAFEQEVHKVCELDEFSPFVMEHYPDYVADFADAHRRSAPAFSRSRTSPYGVAAE